LTLALDGGGDWSDSHPGSFTPGDRTASTHWLEGWVGTVAGVSIAEKI